MIKGEEMSCPQKSIDFIEKVLSRETKYTTFPIPKECIQTVRSMCEAKGIDVDQISPLANAGTVWHRQRKATLYRSFCDTLHLLH